MAKPLVQIALDASKLETALESTAKVSGFAEVIEVGTIFVFGAGVGSVTKLCDRYPDHIIVCDMKITDASAILTRKRWKVVPTGSPSALQHILKRFVPPKQN